MTFTRSYTRKDLHRSLRRFSEYNKELLEIRLRLQGKTGFLFGMKIFYYLMIIILAIIILFTTIRPEAGLESARRISGLLPGTSFVSDMIRQGFDDNFRLFNIVSLHFINFAIIILPTVPIALILRHFYIRKWHKRQMEVEENLIRMFGGMSVLS